MDAVISSNDIRNARRLREGDMLRIPNMDGIRYTVRRGDSLSRISRTYNVPLEVILDANDIRSDAINEGDVFFIPGARMPPDALRLSLGDMFIFPVRRSITSGYGWRADPFTGEQRFHNGIDLRANIGTPIRAAMDGTVVDVGFNREYGNYIILSHHGGYQTLYAHLSTFNVRRGDRVIQGNKIGEVGNTGRSTGPHLHFSVFRNGRHVNPLDLLS
jgi:murein DD-endopeptidase MepM/ murein hydrolase activator NlpD